MRDLMLIVHLLGLTMGVGTSFAFFFLGKRAAKLEKDEALKFIVNTQYMGTMGHIGLTMLIISGGYLMTPYWKILPTSPLLISKLLLVVMLILMIIVMGIASRKAKKGDFSGLKMVRKLGPIALLTGITIVCLAVLVFH